MKRRRHSFGAAAECRGRLTVSQARKHTLKLYHASHPRPFGLGLRHVLGALLGQGQWSQCGPACVRIDHPAQPDAHWKLRCEDGVIRARVHGHLN